MHRVILTPSFVAECLEPSGSEFYLEVMMKVVQNFPVKICLDFDKLILDDYKGVPDKNSLLRTWLLLLERRGGTMDRNVELSINKINPLDCEQRKVIDIADGMFDRCLIISNTKQNFIKYKGEITDKTHQLLDKSECIHFINRSSSNQEQPFIAVLISLLCRMQERKHTVELEDIHNDRVTDFLRNRAFEVGDQTRSGKSEKTSGELDMCIRRRSGVIETIIEALRAKSVGPKDENVINHINKLLYNYDSSGNKENYIICYCEANDFQRFSSSYLKYLKSLTEHPLYRDTYPMIESTDVTDQFTDKNYISVHKSTFDRKPNVLTLYHVVVHFNK